MKRFLNRLGIHGWTHEEDLLLAGAVGRFPVLFVGPSGTAKTMAAERIGRALEIGYAKRNINYEWAYRNVSTAQVEDLVGYPVPPPMSTVEEAIKRGSTPEMVFVDAPDSLRNKKLLIADEISRSDPMTQNRWFSLINERRVDGVDLDIEVIVAAMNPPGAYEGSEVLDRAFGERFALVVHPPSLWQIENSDDRKALIATRIISAGKPCAAAEVGPDIDSDVAEELVHFLEDARSEYARVASSSGESIVNYVEAVSTRINQTLGYAKNRNGSTPGVDGRRASFLAQAICALHAVSRSHEKRKKSYKADLGRDARIVLRHSFVNEVVGDPIIPDATLESAHKEHHSLLQSKQDQLLGVLDSLTNPVDKVAFVLANDFDEQATGAVISSAHNEMSSTSSIHAGAFSAAVLSYLATHDNGANSALQRTPRHVLEEMAADLKMFIVKAKPFKVDLGSVILPMQADSILGALGLNNTRAWTNVIGDTKENQGVTFGIMTQMVTKLNNPAEIKPAKS